MSVQAYLMTAQLTLAGGTGADHWAANCLPGTEPWRDLTTVCVLRLPVDQCVWPWAVPKVGSVSRLTTVKAKDLVLMPLGRQDDVVQVLALWMMVGGCEWVPQEHFARPEEVVWGAVHRLHDVPVKDVFWLRLAVVLQSHNDNMRNKCM